MKGNQVDILGAGLKKSQAGIVALQDALVTQLPASLASQVPKGGPALPAGANLDNAKLQDMLFEVGMAVFKGIDTQVKVSGSIWPLVDEKAAKTVTRKFSA